MPETSSTSQQATFHAAQQADSNPNPTIPIVSVEKSLSAEDKMILYSALQDIANELRRINRERKKHQAKRNQ